MTTYFIRRPVTYAIATETGIGEKTIDIGVTQTTEQAQDTADKLGLPLSEYVAIYAYSAEEKAYLDSMVAKATQMNEEEKKEITKRQSKII